MSIIKVENMAYKTETNIQLLQGSIKYYFMNERYMDNEDLLDRDFDLVKYINIPKLHFDKMDLEIRNFRFKVHSPNVFKFFRKVYGISNETYMKSVCHKCIHLPKKNTKNYMWKTKDRHMMIVELSKREKTTLRCLLKSYFLNQAQHPRSFLPKLYGCYTLKYNNQKIRILVCNSVSPILEEEYMQFKFNGIERRIVPTDEAYIYEFKDNDFIRIIKHHIKLELEILNAIRDRIYHNTIQSESAIHFKFSRLKKHSIIVKKSLSLQTQDTLIPRNNYYASAVQIQQKHYAKNFIIPEGAIYGLIENRPIYIYAGIVDILQQCSNVKNFRNNIKKLFCMKKINSTNESNNYSKRFMEFLFSKLFTAIPEP
ncbi:hypothetical protein A3Q56_01914 [Intoshia linei]|uniref:PIPK domain-containing protein n=1 Tax=Intoshia linei TaxID=1819745 RepID=A0A177B9M7_9BILA|nr:hypothetical protein A3Q56_01914 [Intoshia linei]